MGELAINGGSPIRKIFLPFHKPTLGAEEEEEIVKTLRSGWLTRGPKTERFERMFAEYCKAKHAIGLNSCTAALHLSLVALDIEKGDEVITTPMTFVATANAIVMVGAKPVFVDVEPETLNIDVTQIEEKITPRTRAILPVHYIGQPCEMDPILNLANKHNLAVIEDAAHAIESVYQSKKIGSIGDFTAFSFYATKNITTGEGGMLTTKDDALSEKARILSLHGISEDAWKRYTPEGYAHYDALYLGYKYNMTDLQASLGIHQLPKIEQFWRRRKEIVEAYNQAFKGMQEIAPLQQIPKDGCKNAYHLYVIRVNTEYLKVDRDQILNALQRENIGVGVHYRAVHLHPYYQETLGFKKGDFPNAEYASERVISLPLYPALSDEDVEDVIEAVEKIVTHYRK